MFNNHLMKACLAAVFAIGLTACSSSDSGTQTSEPTTPTTPTTPPGPSPSEQVSDLFAKVSKYGTQASDAQEAAEDALTDATMKAGMLGAIDVEGESATAVANAQAVLDAVGMVAMAATNADSALTALKQAMMDADELPEGTANLDQLKIEIGNAIEAAEANLEAAEGIRDNLGAGSLAALAAMIMGDDGEKTAAMWGMDVASSIQTGLGAWVIGTNHGTTAGTASDTVKNPVSMHDAPASAMTWEEIVGMDNVMTMPLATPTKVASITGMTPAAVGITADIPDGGQTYAATAVTLAGTHNYMGIGGEIFCLATTCDVDDDGNLGAGWYFSPTSDTQRYRHKVGVGYEDFNDFASYGYWVTVDATSGAVDGFNTFATSGAAATVDAAISTEEIGGDDGTATYSGTAAGMSVVTVPNPDGDGRVAGRSGAFTADVTLNATFGGTPTIDGMITDFVGDAVGSGWTVTLRSQTLAVGGGTGTARTDGQAADGGWTAQPYGGDATARPSGIHGGFNANFRDGMAVGAYATRKD